jgi:ABC-type multidrug transport system ATPase subunit
VSNPKCLILDESTSYLDSFNRRMILDQLRKEFRKRQSEGFTIILITQFSREAAHCDRVIVLNNGEICADDVPDKVFTEHQALLHAIGVEIPVGYRFKQEFPDITLPQSLFDYSYDK